MTAGGSRSGMTLEALWVPILPETSKLGLGVESAAVSARAAWDRVTRGMGSAMAGDIKRASEQSSSSLSVVQQAYAKVEQSKISQVSATARLNKAERDLEAAQRAGVAASEAQAAVMARVNSGLLEGEAATKQLTVAGNALATTQDRVATATDRVAVAKAKDEVATRQATAATRAHADAEDAYAAASSRRAATVRTANTVGMVSFFGVAAGMAEAGKAAAEFEYSQTRLVASAGESKENLKGVSDGLLQMAGQVGYTADELSKAMYIVESGGFHGADALKVMSAAAQGAKAEQADLTTVNNGLTTSLHDFHLAASQAPDVMSKMVAAVGSGKTTFEEFAGSLHSVEPVAGAANLKLEDVYSTLAMMTRTGMSADQATENMRNSINALMNPTQQMRDEMGKWGISADDVKEKLSERGLAGTMQYLTSTVEEKMGPAGKAIVDDMYKNAQATQAAKQMLDAMNPSVRAVAESFQKGEITRKDYVAAIKGSSAGDAAQLQQFGVLLTKIDGYSNNLKKGQSTVETYDQAVKTMTGTVAGQTVALAVSGENAADTNKLLGQLNNTTREGDGTVKGFNETSETAKVKWDKMRAAMHSARIELGDAVLPALSGMAEGLKDTAEFLERNQTLTLGLVGTLGTLGTVWAAWKIAMGTKALYDGIADGVRWLATNTSLARDATWGLDSASTAATGSTARAGDAAAVAATKESDLAVAGDAAAGAEGRLAGASGAAAGAEAAAASSAGVAAGAEGAAAGAAGAAAASTGALAGFAASLATGLKGVAAALPTIAAFAALTGPMDHLLEHLPGGSLLKKGEDLTGTGFKSLEPWNWGIWDTMGKDFGNAFSGKGFRNPSWMGGGYMFGDGPDVPVKAKPTDEQKRAWNPSNPDSNVRKLFGIPDNYEGIKVPIQLDTTGSPDLGSIIPGAPPGGLAGSNPLAAMAPVAPGAPPPPPPPGAPPPGFNMGNALQNAIAPPGGNPLDALAGGAGGIPGRGGASQGYVNNRALANANARSSGGAEAWRPVVRWALATFGPQYGITNPAAWEDAMVRQINTESTGNWTAVNNTDSNAAAGNNSRGVLQFVKGTYDHYNILGRPFPDPYGEIAAAIPYVAEKWGIGPGGGPNQIGRGIGFQAGNEVRGQWLPGRDSVPAVLEPGEFVTQRNRAQHMMPFLKWSNLAPVSDLQKLMGILGFQGGGGSGSADYAASGAGDDVAGVIPEILAVDRLAKGYQLTLTAGKSGHGTHQQDGGYHDSGEAGDFSNGMQTPEELAFAQMMFTTYGRNLSELIHSSPAMPNLIKDGNVVPASFYGQDTLAGHRDHVHVAIKPGALGQAGANLTAGSTPLPGGAGSTFMASGAPGGAGAAGAGYTPSPYPGYWQSPSGDYVPEEDVPNKGNYGGATQSQIDSAMKRIDSANDQAKRAEDRIAQLQAERDKLLHPEPAYPGAPAPEAAKPEQIAAKDKEIADAQKAAQDAKADAADANSKYTQVLNKPPEPTRGGSKSTQSDSNVEGLGTGLVKGIAQGLGFDGSVFEDPTQWGIWKLFTGGVNWLGGMGKAIAEHGAPGLGIPAMPAGAGGGGGSGIGGILGGLIPGMASGVGVNLPASSASTVTTAPGMPGLPETGPAGVSTPGTIQPGPGFNPLGGPTGAAPGPVTGSPVDMSVTVNNGTPSAEATAKAVGSVQIAQSRALNIGMPVGGMDGLGP